MSSQHFPIPPSLKNHPSSLPPSINIRPCSPMQTHNIHEKIPNSQFQTIPLGFPSQRTPLSRPRPPSVSYRPACLLLLYRSTVLLMVQHTPTHHPPMMRANRRSGLFHPNFHPTLLLAPALADAQKKTLTFLGSSFVVCHHWRHATTGREREREFCKKRRRREVRWGGVINPVVIPADRCDADCGSYRLTSSPTHTAHTQISNGKIPNN